MERAGQLSVPCSRTISDRPLIQPTAEKPQPNTQIIGPKRGREENFENEKMNSARHRWWVKI